MIIEEKELEIITQEFDTKIFFPNRQNRALKIKNGGNGFIFEFGKLNHCSAHFVLRKRGRRPANAEIKTITAPRTRPRARERRGLKSLFFANAPEVRRSRRGAWQSSANALISSRTRRLSLCTLRERGYTPRSHCTAKYKR